MNFQEKLSKQLFWHLALFALVVSGCRSVESVSQEAPKTQSSPTPQVSSTRAETAATKPVVDVPKLANKPPAELEKLFGKAVKITQIKDVPEQMPGEYRLYNVAGYKDGLSVRFYRDRAVRFNLFLNEETESARDALLKTFAVDVKNAASTKTQFAEKWAGEFNGVMFQTLYAMKKDIKSPKYAMVHAEITQ